MATLVLQVAGSALGGLIGGPVGAIAGRALGALAGASIDGALLGGGGGGTRFSEGPRLRDMQGLSSTEGAPIPRVYGRVRTGGQLIWATRFEEATSVSVTRSRPQGGKGGAPAQKTVTTTYSYYANLAVGLCEGPIAFVRRVWADGKELDQTGFTMRVHSGSETQAPDPLIVAKEGAEFAPAYRGLAYVVFERLALESFGNRVPQFTFEVVRPADGVGRMIRAVCLIPGATEFGYDTALVSQVLEPGMTRPENRHQLTRSTDLAASLDAMQALLPNLQRVSVVVSWFGDDLRAGVASIEPRIEESAKTTENGEWAVAALTRSTARPVSRVNDAPAYGGTPSDASVIRLIAELKARGLEVVLYPFVMMDVPAGNGLPDPWTGGPDQPPYPWRGRITCDPAPGRSGTVDATAQAASQVAHFFGQVQPGQFSAAGAVVSYSGPIEWSLRHQILHYAMIAQAAGGVDGFIIGSELISLTRVRSASGVYPAVLALKQLAADVRLILNPATKVVYAADWTEYGAHVLNGGSEVRFPLDPLWACPDIHAVGIDFYPPLSDWRDGSDHLDATEALSVYDTSYLRTRVSGGEAFDWYYASTADRTAQNRTPITDGAYNKPWIYRAKDLKSWWSNPHVERVGGVELGASTGFVPMSKPIWLTETGIPAVDKGTNGPNVFPDPKSSENAYPPFSRGVRDDLIQARGLEAILSRFDPAARGYVPGENPVSPLYGASMIDPASMFVWSWDARPFPAFPDTASVWADSANWETGHWINGRVDGLTLDRLIAALLADVDAPEAAELAIDGFLDGYIVDRTMSVRDAIEPLCRLYGFDLIVSGGTLAFRMRAGRAVATLTRDEMVPDREMETLRLTRAQETELPHEVRVGFTDGETEYRRAAAASRRLAGTSRRETQTDPAIVTRRAEAQRLADLSLQDVWIGRETAEFSVSPCQIALEAGDIVALPVNGTDRLYSIQRIVDAENRRISARAIEPSIYTAPAPAVPRASKPAPPVPGRPLAVVLDLPVMTEALTALQYLAVYADPWPGAVAVWRSVDGAGYEPFAVAAVPSIVGETQSALLPGPLWRWDRGADLTVRLRGGVLSSVEETAALGGANTFAVQGVDGAWEIFSAASCELVGPGLYRLSHLVRGLGGSEAIAGRSVPAGATVVVLDRSLTPLATSLEDLGRTWRYRVGPANRDHADPAYRTFEATAGPLALKPYAPVRVQAQRGADGVTVTCVRRTRKGGDAWEPLEVPLSEEREAYEVDVLNGLDVRRTLATSIPSVLYPAAQELADFDSPQAALTLNVAQISATIGRGFVRTVTIPVG